MSEPRKMEITYIERLTCIEEHCRGIDSKLKTLCRAVLGDGDTEKSLIARVNTHGAWLKILGAAVIAIPGIVGAIVGILRLLK